MLDEWTGECEDNKHYELDEVARASKKKSKWRCSDGHVWYANVVNRTAQKQGCPYCSNTNRSERVSKARLSNENRLKHGVYPMVYLENN